MGLIEAMSSGSVMAMGFPTGLRETVSAAAWRRPGMWTTRKWYRSDFSQSGIWDVIEAAVAKSFQQGFMVHSNDEVCTAQGEVASFVKRINNG